MNVAPRFIVTQSTRTSRISGAIALLVVIALVAAPLWLSRNGIRLAGEMLVYIGLASLWNLLAGYGGLVSIGQQAYVGLGAYLLFAASMLLGVPPLLAVPLVGVAAAVIALPVSALLFRLRDAYFAIGAWVVAEVFRLGAAQTSPLGGGSGVSLPIGIVKSIGATRETREIIIFDATLATTLLILFTLCVITRSHWGLALQAIRDNEVAAQSSGVDVTRLKRLIYVAASAGAAMLGAVVGLAKRDVLRERLDRFRHFHNRDRWRRADRGADYRHYPFFRPARDPFGSRPFLSDCAGSGWRRNDAAGAERYFRSDRRAP
jgi:branched-chain amino acid transport system permease protein